MCQHTCKHWGYKCEQKRDSLYLRSLLLCVYLCTGGGGREEIGNKHRNNKVISDTYKYYEDDKNFRVEVL